MLVPSIGDCCTPLTIVGSGRPAASRIVGAMSMTGGNCVRSPPLPGIPFGQCTMVPLRVPPQCEATCLVHWNGAELAHAHPTAEWLYELGEARSSLLLSRNSGVWRAAIPLKLAISLNAPLMVPSADAPLSPRM